jgi:asparagine synthase (glutamine-hydrolysing)
MCGIAGAFGFQGSAQPDSSVVDRMSAIMQSRGPDGSGRWVSADGGAVLGHRRLAIIDLTDGGAQPMQDPLTGNVMVFNGEIYNYRELKSDLLARGCAFRTSSDTEVLLHLYREHGRHMLPLLRGMFAFAIHDTARNEMLLARDTYGIKPLYYGVKDGIVWFASQVRALVAGRVLSSRPSAAGQVGFFLFGHVPEPFTLHESIRALAPGSCLVFSGGRSGEYQFDSLAQRVSHARESPAIVDAGQVGEAIRDSVAHHLIADVPVAVFLSAGMDSSAIAALAVHAGAPGLAAITLGFSEYAGLPQDEVPPARRFAGTLGIPHHVDVIGERDFQDSLDHLFSSMDQPSIDGVNTYFVCRAARRAGFKVVLSGLGGDELLGGYSTFCSVPRLAGRIARIPGHRSMGSLVRRLSAPLARSLGRPKAAGILEYGGEMAGAYLLMRSLGMPWELDGALAPDVVVSGLEELGVLERLRESVRGAETGWEQMMLLESRWYMRNQLLRDSDWASMAHSLELRVPLVDVVLLEAVLAARASGRIVDKSALHEAVPGGLPQWLIQRPKTGFTIPVMQWSGKFQSAGRDAGPGLRGWARLVHARFSAAMHSGV